MNLQMGGGKKSEIYADVINGSPLTRQHPPSENGHKYYAKTYSLNRNGRGGREGCYYHPGRLYIDRDIGRADRKSQVRRCLGFHSADS